MKLLPKGYFSAKDSLHTVRPVLMEIRVELGDGRDHVIEIHQNDRPRELARRFCEQRQLNADVQQVLEQHIVDQIETLLKPNLRPSTTRKFTPTAPTRVRELNERLYYDQIAEQRAQLVRDSTRAHARTRSEIAECTHKPQLRTLSPALAKRVSLRRHSSLFSTLHAES